LVQFLKKITFVIRQPGTAAAFIPLIQYFKANKWEAIVLAYDRAYQILLENNISSEPIAQYTDSLSFLKGSHILVTGTSRMVEDDNLYWTWGKQQQIPCIGFVDSWASYSERFTMHHQLDALPQFIAAVDEFMRNRLIEAGITKEKIVITGSPAFDLLVKTKANHHYKKEATEILIITDPYTEINGADVKNKVGFSEFELLDFLFDSFTTILQTKAKDYTLKIKIHPRESLEKYTLYQEKFAHLYKRFEIIGGTANKINLILQSSLVIGMSSILLVEASILGKQTISLQPNRVSANDITDNKAGIRVFTDFDAAYSHLTDAFTNKQNQTFTPSKIPLATPKFVNFIETLIKI